MNKEHIFSKIGGIISEISEQYAYLKANPENINSLELELLIANSHFLSEHLNILKKMDDQSVATEKFIDKPLWESEIVNDKTSHIESSKDEDFYDKDATNQPAEELIHIPEEAPAEEPSFDSVKDDDSVKEIEVMENLTTEESPEINLVIPEESSFPIQGSIPNQSEPEILDPVEEFVLENIVSSEENPNTSTITDRIPTLNEVLSASMKDKTIPKVTFDEVKDLKGMIKLNDKLLFVRDLFNGYSLAYSEAIELLNRFDNFETADNFLKQTYAGKNKWSEKQGTVDHFYAILNKRFN